MKETNKTPETQKFFLQFSRNIPSEGAKLNKQPVSQLIITKSDFSRNLIALDCKYCLN